jgi:hypothetical protein
MDVRVANQNQARIKRRQGGNGAEKKSHFLRFMELTIPAELVNSPLTMHI